LGIGTNQTAIVTGEVLEDLRPTVELDGARVIDDGILATRIPQDALVTPRDAAAAASSPTSRA
jgi:hypothetical protein